ncbi:coatomer epsilon subunit-domain-containing protein [Armillaria novae-zelandiae]|uniref:Coatomer subunit epsilon n=1 Tax=Armillaria novae-zelandiae TaxID=153914 RepID=A0AA39UGW5_9AGAR|nr:coatomer epsilon subunit-domain-containing protein [Armillaria novae-zelandiae]
MDSSELYHVKQQFILARAHIALNDPKSALKLLPADSENVAIKAVAALARYVDTEETEDKESALEELRDLSVEIEGDDVEGTERDKSIVRVLAGTAFARAGEVEEALETLGVGTEDLEAVAVIVQIYLSIHRPDLAKKEFERSKRWAEDDLLLQLIESTISLVTGKDSYSDPLSFYTEQLGNPSLSSPQILTSRGVTRILRGETSEAKSDLEESLDQQKGDAEALAAYVVASGLQAQETWSKLCAAAPSHPLVKDVASKEALFDEAVAKFAVPATVEIDSDSQLLSATKSDASHT